MVLGIVNIIEFNKNLSRGGELEFEAKIARSYLKIFPKDLRNKMRVIEHLKQSKIEFYIIPDREIPLKVVIRGLPTSASTFFHIPANCHMDPSCVGCGGDHLSSDCPTKKATVLPRPPPKCINCDLKHPSSYKGCKNFPVKPQFKKSYAAATK